MPSNGASARAAEILAEAEATMRPLERASTPPPYLYTDPAVYGLETARLFRKSWISIGRVDQIAGPGDYRCYDLLGEPIVAVRDRDNRIRVLSRVCRHRAMLVADGSGNCNAFRCPYHQWTYALDGRLIGAPDMERAEGFDRSQLSLPELHSEVWEGWIFVNLDSGAAPLGPTLAPVSRLIANHGIASWRTTDTRVYDSPWNWKVAVDNFMESYHHAAVHPDNLERIAPGSGTFADDVEGPYSILRNPMRSDAGMSMLSDLSSLKALPAQTTLTSEERSEILAISVFPFHLFAIVPGQVLYYYQIQPIAATRTMLNIVVVAPPGTDGPEHAAAIRQLSDFVAAVHHEDIPICQQVQLGLGSKGAQAGRYSHLEKALWQFHRHVLRAIGGETNQEGAIPLR